MKLEEIDKKYRELCKEEKEFATGFHRNLGKAFMARINFEATHFSKMLDFAMKVKRVRSERFNKDSRTAYDDFLEELENS